MPYLSLTECHYQFENTVANECLWLFPLCPVPMISRHSCFWRPWPARALMWWGETSLITVILTIIQYPSCQVLPKSALIMKTVGFSILFLSSLLFPYYRFFPCYLFFSLYLRLMIFPTHTSIAVLILAFSWWQFRYSYDTS